MEIYDESWNKLEAPDLTLGTLVASTRTIHVPEVQAVARQSHDEVVAEYPNGGKDVREVVDVEGVEGHEAYDCEEPCYIYRPYTAEEKARLNEYTPLSPDDLGEMLLDQEYRLILLEMGM